MIVPKTRSHPQYYGRPPGPTGPSRGGVSHARGQGQGKALMRSEGGSPGRASGWDGAGRRRRTIAIIEDEEEMRRAYSSYLRKQGYDSVVTFATGESFEKAVEEGRTSPDLVLVDYRLPGKDGIETARGLTGQHPNVKVIVTTADDSVSGEVRLLGFHFLQKPFSLATLARMMDRL